MKPASEIIIYEGGEARVEVRLDQDTVWLTQEQMAQLFGGECSVITKHVRHIFASGELACEAATSAAAPVEEQGELA